MPQLWQAMLVIYNVASLNLLHKLLLTAELRYSPSTSHTHSPRRQGQAANRKAALFLAALPVDCTRCCATKFAVLLHLSRTRMLQGSNPTPRRTQRQLVVARMRCHIAVTSRLTNSNVHFIFANHKLDATALCCVARCITPHDIVQGSKDKVRNNSANQSHKKGKSV